jgi:NAD(P)-dependent dehydrogenase (short-subunit alcohol dehydrogenase family)
VVTGAASGIGHAMAEAFAAQGMRVVLADVEVGALGRATAALRASGATVLAVPADVSKGEQVQVLADRAVAEFGRVDVVCNNAGVALSGPIWEHTVADWEWLLGVNLWGVIHGVRTFVPLMLRQGGEGHVVNTASIAGLTSNPFMGPYNVSKHAVVTLSETLHKELGLLGHPVKVSVLCPGFVATRILESERNRPAGLQNATAGMRDPGFEEMARNALAAGIQPAQAAAQVVDAITQERFWVLTHPEYVSLVRARMEDVVEGRNPAATLGLG